ncbi:hypothetical protein GWC77_25875 [Paraburkholderia sp. NMBU_R16]|uniref:hypothetical protein n=1 Tax=Paraburkholderia sp. NMBU_R16 TaxID=2698676 RepID=UPI00156707D2|nr:hypothetical protein [Paraburkholderia sp. NMBU_R16]NRO99319.1 hypothetical protein [Paraburkholderia sp. NMBU_R16]
MKFRVKSLLVTSMLGMTCAAGATGIPDIDPSALQAYIAQARQIHMTQAQERDEQAETPPRDIAASPTARSERPAEAASASANTNQQLLAQLIGIHTTLQELLELERSKVSSASH